MKVQYTRNSELVTGFLVTTPREEREKMSLNAVLKTVFDQLTSLNQNREIGPMRIPTGTRFEPILRVLAEFCESWHRYVSLGQFLTVCKIIVLAKLDLRGEKALQIMEHLYRLTPGGCKCQDKQLQLEEGEREMLRVYKETIETDGAPKTTVILEVPAGSGINRRLIGTAGGNIKALGTLFVPNAGIHFWIKEVVKSIDLEVLLTEASSTPPVASPAPELETPAEIKPKSKRVRAPKTTSAAG